MLIKVKTVTNRDLELTTIEPNNTVDQLKEAIEASEGIPKVQQRLIFNGKPLQDGDQWWSSSEGRMHIYYIDEDSAQWVQSSGDGGTGIPDCPNNGQYYVRKHGEWVRLIDAITDLGVAFKAN